MRLPKSILLRVSLALLLVFAQQQFIKHGLAHDFERIHAPAKDAVGTGEAFCATCLAIGHLGHAAGSAKAPALPVALPSTTYEPESRASLALAILVAYRSRAPPVFS